MKTFSGHYHRRHSISTQKDPQNNMDIPWRKTRSILSQLPTSEESRQREKQM
jgi:hypothetical protein